MRVEEERKDTVKNLLEYNTKSVLASCCDPDGLCYGDGTDDWCCGETYYCSNNGRKHAELKGGIECPLTPRKDVAFIINITGITITVALILLFINMFRKKAASISYI